MSGLVRRQLAQTRKELEREQRAQAKRRLVELRAELKGAKGRRRERMAIVSSECRANRKRISERARAARERLNAAIRREREQAKAQCGASRESARGEFGPELARLVRALEGERGSQRQLAAWTRPSGPTVSARERRQESDDEVRANIDDPQLLPVWEKVKRRIKGRGRTSRTEAFAEWVASHAAEVYEIQNAELEREIAELEREEMALARALAKAKPRARAREAVPF